MSKRVLDMISQAASRETEDLKKRFIAPVHGGCPVIRVSIGGLIKTLPVRPQDFEGWGMFECRGRKNKTARMVREPSYEEIRGYLSRLPSMKLRLCLCPGDDSNWIAYPCNEESMRKRFGSAEPVVVRLVDGASKFDSIIARHDGIKWWFDSIDMSDNLLIIDEMRNLSSSDTPVESIRISGMTPEMRKAYDINKNPVPVTGAPDVEIPMTDEERVAHALERAGGRLLSFVDRGDRWAVEWETSTRERHSSAINKEDMTVMSAGICLSGEDSKFDLQTLVGVVEGRYSDDDYYDDDW
jgi:hypothetical protein